MEWWQTVLAGLAGGVVPAAVAVISLRYQSRDRDLDRQHELQMQTHKFEHERAERLRSTAADTFVSTRQAIESCEQALLKSGEFYERADSDFAKASRLLQTLTIEGWTEGIRDSARVVLGHLEQVYGSYNMLYLTIDDPEAEGHETKLEESKQQTRQSLEELRRAVADS